MFARWSLVYPLVSPTGEPLRQVSERCWAVDKAGGTVVVESKVPLQRIKTARERGFNPVPGLEAIPLRMEEGGGGGGVVFAALRWPLSFTG